MYLAAKWVYTEITFIPVWIPYIYQYDKWYQKCIPYIYQYESVMQLTLNYIHVILTKALVNAIFIFVSIHNSIIP